MKNGRRHFRLSSIARTKITASLVAGVNVIEYRRCKIPNTSASSTDFWPDFIIINYVISIGDTIYSFLVIILCKMITIVYEQHTFVVVLEELVDILQGLQVVHEGQSKLVSWVILWSCLITSLLRVKLLETYTITVTQC